MKTRNIYRDSKIKNGVLKIPRILSVMLCGIIMFSCINESDVPEPENPNPLTKEYYLRMRVPVTGTPATYGLSSLDENTISNVDILIFESVSGQDRFLYRVDVNSITKISDSADGKNKIYKIPLKWTDPGQNIKVMVLANCRGSIPVSIIRGTPKEDLLKNIQFSVTGKWPYKAIYDSDAGAQEERPFPMWGETPGYFAIDENTPEDAIGSISLVRAIARVDVGLNYDGDGVAQGLLNEFKMKEVFVFNAKSKGYVSPVPSTLYNGTIVNEANVPPGDISNTRILKYNEVSSNKYELAMQIYLAEAMGLPASEWNNATGLVIGGYYSNDPFTENTSKVTYYRVDFMRGDKIAYDDIIRNHRYRVNITKVKGAGWDTPEQAWSARNENMEVEIKAWDDSNVDEVKDGIYVLRSQTKVILPNVATTRNQIPVLTNHPEGWKATVDNTLYPYITIRTPQGNPIMWDIIEVDATANSTGLDRVAEIYLTAGRMSKKIKIYQSGGLKTNIDPWTEKPVDESASNFYLTLSQTDICFVTGNPLNITGSYTANIDIFSNYYKGLGAITTRVVGGDGWLYSSGISSYNQGDRGSLRIDVYPVNSPLDHQYRQATVYIKAGNIEKNLTVSQNIQSYTINSGYTYQDKFNNTKTLDHNIMFTTHNQKYDGNQSWYVYANVPNNYNNNNTAAAQVSPARDGSCAQLNEVNYLGFNNWRLPTTDEMDAFFWYCYNNSKSLLNYPYLYNLASGMYFTSTPYDAGVESSRVYIYSTQTYNSGTETGTTIPGNKDYVNGYVARCVRTHITL